jgi:hypothetical protein
MIARAYDPKKDFEAVKDLIGSRDVDPARDLIVVVEIGGRIVEVVAIRPCVFVHDFELTGGALRRQATDAALSYAMGASRAMGHREAIVIVAEDKTRMRAWWEEHGARQQDPGAVYVIEIL